MAHDNQYAVALACKIINEQHGPVVEVRAVFPPILPCLLARSSRHLHCRRPAPCSVTSPSPRSQDVARQLIRHGRQTLPELIRVCERPAPLVRQAMLVLLQHNHARAFTVRPDPEALVIRPPYCVYQADLSRTLSCLRQPRMLLHIRCACRWLAAGHARARAALRLVGCWPRCYH